MDAGYDRPKPGILSWKPSTWNNYYEHNVMTAHGRNSANGGGLLPPKRDIFKRHIVASQQSVGQIYGATHGNITELSASPLILLSVDEAGRTRSNAFDYHRKVLFIADGDDSYVLDINGVRHRSQGPPLRLPTSYTISYWVNSPDTSLKEQSGQQAYVWSDLYRSRPGITDLSRTTYGMMIQSFAFESRQLKSEVQQL